MSFTPEQIAMLQADLDGSQVKTRQQAGISLSYIEGWAAIDTANKIFGFGEWGIEIMEYTHIGTREVEKNGRKGWEVGYRARVRVAGTESWPTEDTGFGSGVDYNSPFAAHESAGKEAVTDALKRALKNFGYPFGLALYDKTQEHVDNGVPGPTVATDVKRAPTTQPSTPPSGSSEDFNPNFIDPGATVITWGKHKGKTLRVVGSSYADFMLKKIAEDGKPSKLQPILKAFADQRADEKAAELAATIAKGAAKEPDGSEGMTIGDIAQAFDVDPEGFINYD
jgi:DNA repair and recombination protein RAD52